MLRGSRVRILHTKYWQGEKSRPDSGGIALERIVGSRYIRVLEVYDNYLTDLRYPESYLEVIEPPVEL